MSKLMKRLYEIKQDSLFADSTYRTKTYEDNVLKAIYSRGGKKIIGIFSLKGEPGIIPINVGDGRYENLIDGSSVEVMHGYISLNGEPIIIRAQ